MKVTLPDRQSALKILVAKKSFKTQGILIEEALSQEQILRKREFWAKGLPRLVFEQEQLKTDFRGGDLFKAVPLAGGKVKWVQVPLDYSPTATQK